MSPKPGPDCNIGIIVAFPSDWLHSLATMSLSFIYAGAGNRSHAPRSANMLPDLSLNSFG